METMKIGSVVVVIGNEVHRPVVLYKSATCALCETTWPCFKVKTAILPPPYSEQEEFPIWQ